jgi:hypothetical protein
MNQANTPARNAGRDVHLAPRNVRQDAPDASP